MSQWAIGQVAARSGVPASTIRYYEEIGLLPPAIRVKGRRRYNAAILSKLRIIRRAQRAGFTIAEIQSLMHDFAEDSLPAARWAVLAHAKLDELEAQMRDIQHRKMLLTQLLDCECVTLEECGFYELNECDRNECEDVTDDG